MTRPLLSRYTIRPAGMFRTAALAAACALVLPVVAAHTPAAAAQELDDGSKSRINKASMLRMLSQRVARASCRIEHDLDAADAAQVLR